MKQTKEVKAAIDHVKSFYPSLKTVIFTSAGWLYMDEYNDGLVFDNRIDTTILENAMDSIDILPAIFEIN